ncbi:MAG: hypothetical protein IPJ77_17965 [Planctomycetes bacterium]|nr:hypothetical protein [Planctomycetota bacterium]
MSTTRPASAIFGATTRRYSFGPAGEAMRGSITAVHAGSRGASVPSTSGASNSKRPRASLASSKASRRASLGTKAIRSGTPRPWTSSTSPRTRGTATALLGAAAATDDGSAARRSTVAPRSTSTAAAGASIEPLVGDALGAPASGVGESAGSTLHQAIAPTSTTPASAHFSFKSMARIQGPVHASGGGATGAGKTSRGIQADIQRSRPPACASSRARRRS